MEFTPFCFYKNYIKRTKTLRLAQNKEQLKNRSLHFGHQEHRKKLRKKVKMVQTRRKKHYNRVNNI